MSKVIEKKPMPGGDNAAYCEALYDAYLANPQSVSPQWQEYFREWSVESDVSHADIQEKFKQLANHRYRLPLASPEAVTYGGRDEDSRIGQLIMAYRQSGHHLASLDPLELHPKRQHPELTPEYYGFSEQDLSQTFKVRDIPGVESCTLSELLSHLKSTYASKIGCEFLHITDHEQVEWIKTRLEQFGRSRECLSEDQKTVILSRLVAAEGLEQYLGRRYVGQKRFSLEGLDALIPALDRLIGTLASHEVSEVVLGMAHRGRLNVLVNIFGKHPKELFDEFEGGKSASVGSGDVKYHMGFSTDITIGDHEMHLTMAFNPSHLEIVNPVVMGSVRARQDKRYDVQHERIVPVLLHGDAAFAGQGVVMECFALSQARGFKTGGTIHIITNNQIGFTTNNPHDSRSTLYCTDVAKMVRAPIFHVNAEDMESVSFIMQLAVDYRMAFKRDVVIDLIGYRRHGHNEADEPRITQPLMYQEIRKRPSVAELYANSLPESIGSQLSSLRERYREQLDNNHCVALYVGNRMRPDEYAVNWSAYLGGDLRVAVDTKLLPAAWDQLKTALMNLPKDFALQAQVQKEYDARRKMLSGHVDVNWGCAETLAYGSLLLEGFNVRLCGQDSGRGTFAHRHAVLHEQHTGRVHIPLQDLGAMHQGQFYVIDSVLSEEAVMGFEYGYACADPNTLVLWEAQFGDFANGAQVIIDQFLSAGEQKWGRLCGLVLLLPHGYEGQGPEHSSARLERYLQLCAQHNMQVCVPTTASQIFHLLRRQMMRQLRKPLVVMSPKSNLRNPAAASEKNLFLSGKFLEVYGETQDLDSAAVERVVLCSGKVYFDLLSHRESQQLENTAILRLEQLYPFPDEALSALLSLYPGLKKVVWCQEEPKNQGAWYQIRHRIHRCLGEHIELVYSGRLPMASTACGYAKQHQSEQAELVSQAFVI